MLSCQSKCQLKYSKDIFISLLSQMIRLRLYGKSLKFDWRVDFQFQSIVFFWCHVLWGGIICLNMPVCVILRWCGIYTENVTELYDFHFLNEMFDRTHTHTQASTYFLWRERDPWESMCVLRVRKYCAGGNLPP